MSLARTGLERDLRFRAALRDYRSLFTSYYDRKSRELIVLTKAQGIPTVVAKQNFTDLPAFEFQEESLASSLDRALPDLGFLLVWSLVLFAAAHFRFLRYDVR
jgi:ABC-type transport system involved in multi-copper enzyme maturation permease subunit